MKSSVPFLDQDLIEGRAERALAWVRPSTLKTPSRTPVEEIALKLAILHKVQFQFEHDLGFSERKKKILGMCQLRPLIVYVDRSLNRDGPRFRFTLAHELGHLSLHRNLWLNPVELDMPGNQVRDDRSHVFGVRRIMTARDRLEWQANAFAAALLMPRKTLRAAVRGLQEKLEIRRVGQIYVDDQPSNKADYFNLMRELSDIFGVSQTALSIRLRDLRMLVDQRSTPRHIVSLFRVA